MLLSPHIQPDKIYVDYYPGTHGQFLEKCLNLFLYGIEPQVENKFHSTGSSHVFDEHYLLNRKVIAGHLSGSVDILSPVGKTIDMVGCPVYTNPTNVNTLIGITATKDVVLNQVYYIYSRIGDYSFNINDLVGDTKGLYEYCKDAISKDPTKRLQTLVASTIEQIKTENSIDTFDLPARCVREHIKNKMHEFYAWQKNSNKYQGAQTVIPFPFKHFYDLSLFYSSLASIADTLGVSQAVETSILKKYWFKFLQNIQNYPSIEKTKKEIISTIDAQLTSPLTLDVVSEAFLLFWLETELNIKLLCKDNNAY